MTLTTTSTTVVYSGNGSTTAFAVPFQFYTLVVTETSSGGVVTTKTLGTHYTVTGGSGSTGTVTMLTAPASGVTLTITRSTARTQLADYAEGEAFPAATHESALDKIVMMLQEIETDLGDLEEDTDAFDSRSLVVPEGDTAASRTLPTAAARADKYLRFTSDGSPSYADGIAIESDFLQAGTGAAVRSSLEKMRETWSLTDFEGVDKTGATDSTVGMQACIDAAIAVGGADIKVPVGDYKYDHLTITGASTEGYIRFIGDGGRSNTILGIGTAVRGPRFICTNPATDGILIDGMQSVIIENIGIKFNRVAVNSTSVSRANPAVVTATGHGLANGTRVWCTAATGMTELIGNVYTVANAATDSFELSGLNSSGFGADGTSVNWSTVPASGAAIYSNDGNRLIIRDCYIEYVYNGIVCVGTSRPQILGTEVINAVGKAGIRLQGKIGREVSTGTVTDVNSYPNNAVSKVSPRTNGIEIGTYCNSTRLEWTRVTKAQWGFKVGETLATVGGTANAITLTDSDNFWEEMRDGTCAAFTATATSSSITPTLNLNGMGAKTVKADDGADLGVGDIASGSTYTVMYSEDDDAWLLKDDLDAPAFIRWDGCATETCGQSGILANSFSMMVFHQLYCCLSDGHGIHVPAQAAVAERPTLIVTDSRISSNDLNGIYLETCPSVFISNCAIGGNSFSAPGTYDGIRVSAADGFLSVMGCQIGGSTFELPNITSHQRYGIAFTSGVTDPRFRIIGNNLQGNTTGGLLDQSTNSATTRGNKKVRGNVGIPDWIDSEVVHGIVSVSLSANTDDWTFSGIDGCRWVRVAPSAEYYISGIVAPTDGNRRLIISNNSSTYTILLKHNTGSTAANRFDLPNSVDYALSPNTMAEFVYDVTSTRWRVAGIHAARLDREGQVLAGGASITSKSLTASTSFTADCGARPLQYITNNGAFTITAPAADGSMVVLVTNGATAGAITFTGFTVRSGGTGDALTTTNGDKFAVSITRINSVAFYSVQALQ